MIDELGLPFSAFIVLLYIMTIIDVIGLVLVFKKEKADRHEYCRVGIKWYKVIFGLLFAGMLLYMIMIQPFSAYVMWIMLILAVLLLVVEGINLIIKLKYGKKRK
ncbi:MAG: hypothetical protein IJ007_10265 [Oscillospiraceae bacterium]|nr:hypothetical protein [Oscillospiraceae bacterium]